MVFFRPARPTQTQAPNQLCSSLLQSVGSFISKNFRAQTELFDAACCSLSLFKQTKIPLSASAAAALNVKIDVNLICILFSGFETLSFRALGAVEFQPKAFSLETLSLNQFESKVIYIYPPHTHSPGLTKWSFIRYPSSVDCSHVNSVHLEFQATRSSHHV